MSLFDVVLIVIAAGIITIGGRVWQQRKSKSMGEAHS
jgi:hypothetical protein